MGRSRLTVAIGASAGGLAAIFEFFEALEPALGVCFVVVQHLSPDHPSMMTELLSRHTPLDVVTAVDGSSPAADTVHLIPPNTHLVLEAGVFRLRERAHDVLGRSLPIDVFFSSLADGVGEAAVAVVLSGSGADGSVGLVDVSKAGGVVMAQDPTTAGFGGMPQAALRTGAVDHVGSPAQLAAAVTRLARSSGGRPEVEMPFDLGPLIDALRSSLGIDLGEYKEATIRRRTLRRMALLRIAAFDAYLERVRRNPLESAALMRDLLIGVSSFFRDPDAWEVLDQEVLRPLVRERDDERPVRAWICGCSTGEEVYTLAMLLAEAFAEEQRAVATHLFATDLSDEAIRAASAGVYTLEQLQPIGTDRIARYFDAIGPGRYRVGRALRKLVVFARHDVTRDTPFSRVDLVICRNMLIYMKPELQRRVLQLLRFALVPGGALFLGQAETLFDLGDMFATVDGARKIWRTRGEARMPLRDLMSRVEAPPAARWLPALPTRAPQPASTPTPESMLREVIEALLGERYATGLVVHRDRLVYLLGQTPPYLRFAPGRPSAELSGLLPENLWSRAHAALVMARNTRRAARSGPVVFRFDGRSYTVDVAVHPLRSAGGEGGQELLLLGHHHEADADHSLAELIADEPVKGQVVELSRELQQVRESLQTTIEELETTNEEHQSTNEELQASNEELQSTNEELHSVNEELKTLNAEYQEKIHQLLELQADVDGLLEALAVGILFLDGSGRLLRFNRAAAEVFHVAPIDVGRPLWHLADEFVAPAVRQTLRRALESGVPTSVEGDITSGERVRAQLSPIAGPQGERFVLTLVDLTEGYEAQNELRANHALLAGLAEHLPDVLWVIEADGRYRFISEAYEAMWGLSVAEVMAAPETFAQRLHPDDREQVLADLSAGLSGKGFDTTYRIVRPDGSMVWARGRGVPVFGDDGTLLRTVGSIVDVTDQVEAKRERDALLERFELTVDALGDVVYDHRVPEGRMEWGGAYERVLGYRADTIGSDPASWLERVHPVDRPRLQGALERALAGDRVFEHRYRFRTAPGAYVWVVDRGALLVDDAGDLRRVVGILRPLGPVDADARAAFGGLVDHLDASGARAFRFRFDTAEVSADPPLPDPLARQLVERLRRFSLDDVSLGGILLESLAGEEGGGELLVLGRVGIDVGERVTLEGRVLDLAALRDLAAGDERTKQGRRELLDNLPLAAWVVDAEGETVVANPRADQWRLEAAEEARMVEHLGAETTLREERVLEHRSLGARSVRSMRHRLPNGLLLCTEEDVTEQRRAEDELRTRASRDALTGLWVRSLFVERLTVLCARQARKGSRTFAVIFMDLDGFKEVNDSYDHFVGDGLLVGFAQRLQGLARPGDAVARFGGDEFAILVDDVTDYRDVLEVARRIHRANLEPVGVGERQFVVRASIGIAVYDAERHTPESLLRDADVAMYEAKRSPGESTVVFDAQMHAQVLQRHETKRDLDVALERGEFRLHLQPIHRPTGEVAGYESLIRWQHPRRGLIFPGDFLALAGESGLMHGLEVWVLHELLSIVQAHPSVFHPSAPPLLSVNVTPHLLRSGAFHDWVVQVGDRGVGAHAQIVLEIVEETMLTTDPAVRAALQQARAVGMKIAIDDFGTGYSSLSYLMNWPIDLLKLDGSFAAQVANERAVKVVRSLVELAESLDLQTILEGVEDDEQLAFSGAVGVDFIQGHRFGRAAEPAALFGDG